MADKKNLCAQIDTALHARVRQEQEQSGKTLSEYVEQLITDYYNMKENTKMTGDTRTLATQIPEELFERLKAYLKKKGLKQRQFHHWTDRGRAGAGRGRPRRAAGDRRSRRTRRTGHGC